MVSYFLRKYNYSEIKTNDIICFLSFLSAKFIRSQKKGNLRRSMSDRRLPDERERISFKDTTALRPKPIRPKIYQRQSMPVRPSSPPPQLPTTAMKPRSTSVPVRPPRKFFWFFYVTT